MTGSTGSSQSSSSRVSDGVVNLVGGGMEITARLAARALFFIVFSSILFFYFNYFFPTTFSK